MSEGPVPGCGCARCAVHELASWKRLAEQRDAEIHHLRESLAATRQQLTAVLQVAGFLRENVACEHLHHTPREYHDAAPCPVTSRLDATLAAARGAA